MNRREFLAAGLTGTTLAASRAGTLSGAPSAGSVGAGPPPARPSDPAAATPPAEPKTKPPIVDVHTHFYDPSRPEGVPWPGRNDKTLYRTVLPPEYRKLAEPEGVVGTVVVEASPRVEDNAWLLDLAAKDPYLLGIVGRLDPAGAEFDKHLKRFAADPLFRGIRISQNDLAGVLKNGHVRRLGLLAEAGLALDVNGGPAMPAEVARLAAELPRLRIVINHCANLKIDGKDPPPAWVEAMTAAAKHERVFCKASALVEQTATKPAPRDAAYYAPVLATLFKLFGEDRLLFGSNWPVSDRAAPFATVVGVVRDWFAAKGAAVSAKYFHDNSRAAYGWKKR